MDITLVTLFYSHYNQYNDYYTYSAIWWLDYGSCTFTITCVLLDEVVVVLVALNSKLPISSCLCNSLTVSVRCSIGHLCTVLYQCMLFSFGQLLILVH